MRQEAYAMKYLHYAFATTIILLLGSLSAFAEETGAVDAVSAPAFGEPIPDDGLSAYRGGSALQISEMKLDSKLLDNQAIANITGSNFVTQSAFSGASGFSTVVQNSGNNVIIQNATILNLSLH